MTAYLSVRLGISFAGTLLLSRWAAAFVPNEVASEKVALVWRFGNSCQHGGGGKKRKKQEEKQLQFFATCFPTLLMPLPMQVVGGCRGGRGSVKSCELWDATGETLGK